MFKWLMMVPIILQSDDKTIWKINIALQAAEEKKIVYVDESYSNSRATGHTFTFTPPAVPERQPIEDVYPKLKKL